MKFKKFMFLGALLLMVLNVVDAKATEGDTVCMSSYCSGPIMPITVDAEGFIIEKPKLGVTGHYVEGDPYLATVGDLTDYEITRALDIGYTTKHLFTVMLDNAGNSGFYVTKKAGVKALEDAGMSDDAIPVYNIGGDCEDLEYIDDIGRVEVDLVDIMQMQEASSRVNTLLNGADEGELDWNK